MKGVDKMLLEKLRELIGQYLSYKKEIETIRNDSEVLKKENTMLRNVIKTAEEQIDDALAET